MIVVDENIQEGWLIDGISRWYRGSVLSIKQLRPNSVIKDESIPVLLHHVNAPTFITINVQDFWRVQPAHPNYCLVTFPLPQQAYHHIPLLLRTLLKLPEFSTKKTRMGKIVRVRVSNVDYYGLDRIVHRIEWQVDLH